MKLILACPPTGMPLMLRLPELWVQDDLLLNSFNILYKISNNNNTKKKKKKKDSCCCCCPCVYKLFIKYLYLETIANGRVPVNVCILYEHKVL